MKTTLSRGQDEVQFAAENLLRVKRRGMPWERTMGTGCISENIIVSVCEDIYTTSVSRCKESVLNRMSNLKSKCCWVVPGGGGGGTPIYELYRYVPL